MQGMNFKTDAGMYCTAHVLLEANLWKKTQSFSKLKILLRLGSHIIGWLETVTGRSNFRIPGHFIYMCHCALKNEVYNSSCYSYSVRCK